LERRFSKHNSVIRLKSNILPPKIYWLATPLATTIETYFTLDLPITKRFCKQKRKQHQNLRPLYIN